jgi:hypothetical protein
MDDRHYFYIFLSTIAILSPQKKILEKNAATKWMREMGMA